MSPSEDAALLLITVRRHLRSMAMSLDPAFAQEDWGFLAQQALEKVLKARIVLADREPPLTHDLNALADLPGERQEILDELETLTRSLEERLNS